MILEDQKSKQWMDILSHKGFSINMGFEENDEINEDGIELERLYDNIFYNNKEV